jgi:DNA invertase Pin-like site-specific DNA recombinase
MKTRKKLHKPKKISLRYLPKRLSYRDKKKQSKMLLKSKKMYKKGKYYTRKQVKSFKSKPSSHVLNAKKMYNVKKIGATNELARKTGCSKSALAKIINKGVGAYYSSGSRPNQTAQSWGIARLASALTSGKAGAIDYDILNDGCKPGSKGFKAAQKARKIHGFGKRKVPKVNL